MPILNVDLSIDEARLARRAATTLSDDFGPEFEEQVEVALVTGELPERHSFAVEWIPLISVLIAAASQVWTMWKDIRDRQPHPSDKDNIVKAVLHAMEDVVLSPDQKLRIVRALVEQLK